MHGIPCVDALLGQEALFDGLVVVVAQLKRRLHEAAALVVDIVLDCDAFMRIVFDESNGLRTVECGLFHSHLRLNALGGIVAGGLFLPDLDLLKLLLCWLEDLPLILVRCPGACAWMCVEAWSRTKTRL